MLMNADCDPLTHSLADTIILLRNQISEDIRLNPEYCDAILCAARG